MSIDLAWFKSSYSGTEGGACVEVAISWRKSSYSDTEGGECVEIGRREPSQVHIRDSKKLHGEILTINQSEWERFLSHVRT